MLTLITRGEELCRSQQLKFAKLLQLRLKNSWRLAIKAMQLEARNLYNWSVQVTGEAQLLPTNSDFITVRPAIQRFWQARINPGVNSVKLESVETEAHEEIAIEVGVHSVQGQENQVLDRRNYIAIWKLENGQWKLHRDIFLIKCLTISPC